MGKGRAKEEFPGGAENGSRLPWLEQVQRRAGASACPRLACPGLSKCLSALAFFLRTGQSGVLTALLGPEIMRLILGQWAGKRPPE